MINRRQLMTNGSILAVPSMIGLNRLASAQPAPIMPQLSPAVLSAVTNEFVRLGVKAHQDRSALFQSDITSSSSMLTLLENHFNEVGFDESLKHALSQRQPDSLDVTQSPMIKSTYEALSKVDPTFTHEEVTSAFTRVLTPDLLSIGLDRLRTEGLTHSIHTLATGMPKAVLGRLPSAAYRLRMKPFPDLIRTQYGFTDPGIDTPTTGQEVCFYISQAAQAAGAAAFTLAWGCIPPDPLFIVICPAILALGVIAGVLGIISWIFC